MTEASLFGRETRWELRDGTSDQDQHWGNCSRGDPGDHPDFAQLLGLQDATLRAADSDEGEFLRNYRTEMFLLDDDAPLAISAKLLLSPRHRERALAELDGMTAGFKFLDKLHERAHSFVDLCQELQPETWYGEILCGVGHGQRLSAHGGKELE